MSRGEWPPIRPPTHLVQHSLTQSTGTHATAPHAHAHSATPSAQSGGIPPPRPGLVVARQKERSSGSTTRVYIITWRASAHTRIGGKRFFSSVSVVSRNRRISIARFESRERVIREYVTASQFVLITCAWCCRRGRGYNEKERKSIG